MTAISWEDLEPEFVDDSYGESRAIDAGGMTIAFERLNGGVDTGPWLEGLPDDMCPDPHWGYLVSGRFRLRTKDGDIVVEAGQAYYAPPGHVLVTEEDCQIIEFTPAVERKRTLDHALARFPASIADAGSTPHTTEA